MKVNEVNLKDINNINLDDIDIDVIDISVYRKSNEIGDVLVLSECLCVKSETEVNDDTDKYVLSMINRYGKLGMKVVVSFR